MFTTSYRSTSSEPDRVREVFLAHLQVCHEKESGSLQHRARIKSDSYATMSVECILITSRKGACLIFRPHRHTAAVTQTVWPSRTGHFTARNAWFNADSIYHLQSVICSRQCINSRSFYTVIHATHPLTNKIDIFTVLHGMQTRSSDENSVRLSVRPSVCHLTFLVNSPRCSEIADFQPIFTRSSSAVTPSERSSINTTPLRALQWA